MKVSYLLFLLAILFSLNSYSQICKRGVIDCPGICGRFQDNDNDQICDFSPRSTPTQKVEATVSKGTTENQKHAETNTPEVNNKQHAANKKDVEKTQTKIKEEEKQGEKNTDKTTVEQNSILTNTKGDSAIVKEQTSTQKETKSREKPYPLILICAITLGLYFGTSLLVKLNTIKKQTHRKIWNVILLITFLMSGLLGFFLVVQLNYHIGMSWYVQLLKLHVEFGIAMAIISIFHTWWHLSYYLNIFKGKNKSKEA